MAPTPQMAMPRLLLPAALVLALASAQEPFCGRISDPASALTLQCLEPDATIAEVLFADYGEPSGGCSAPSSNPKCTSASYYGAFVKKNCTGRHSCALSTFWPGVTPHRDPCYGTPKSLLVRAKCSAGVGCSAPWRAHSRRRVYRSEPTKQ